MRENLSYIFFKELTGRGAAWRAGAAGDAARHRRGRPQFRAARRAGVPRRRPQRSRRPVGGAGHRRGDQGRQPLRHLLGRGCGGRSHRRRHVGERAGDDPAAQGRGGACARSSADEAALWAQGRGDDPPLVARADCRAAAKSAAPAPPVLSAPMRAAPRGRVPPPRAAPSRHRRVPRCIARRSMAAGTSGCDRARSARPHARPSRPPPRRGLVGDRSRARAGDRRGRPGGPADHRARAARRTAGRARPDPRRGARLAGRVAPCRRRSPRCAPRIAATAAAAASTSSCGGADLRTFLNPHSFNRHAQGERACTIARRVGKGTSHFRDEGRNGAENQQRPAVGRCRLCVVRFLARRASSTITELRRARSSRRSSPGPSAC